MQPHTSPGPSWLSEGPRSLPQPALWPGVSLLGFGWGRTCLHGQCCCLNAFGSPFSPHHLALILPRMRAAGRFSAHTLSWMNTRLLPERPSVA